MTSGGLTEYPNLGNISTSPERREHILVGDPPETGHGPGRPSTKDKFPDTWTDDQAIERVANSPTSTWKQADGPGYHDAPITVGGPDPHAPSVTSKGKPTRFIVRNRDHGLNIEVLVEPNGEGVITGDPL